MSEPVERLRSFLMDGCNARAEDLRDALDDLASLGAERKERIKYANEAVRLMRVESELESRIEAMEKAIIDDVQEGRAEVDKALTQFGYDDERFADVRHGWLCSTRRVGALVPAALAASELRPPVGEEEKP